MPEELKKEIFEYSRLNKLDLDKLTKFKAAKALEIAAGNESGAAGAGIGMGMGFAMAQQMGGMLNPQAQNTNATTPQHSNNATPPPLPQQTQYFYAANGQQLGPVSFEGLSQLFASRTVNATTLVWKQGMVNWAALNTVTELQALLGSVPPPLPNN